MSLVLFQAFFVLMSGEYGRYKRQSRPEIGLGVQVKVLYIFCVVPSLLGSGQELSLAKATDPVSGSVPGG